ncbi:MAG: hypothetical protein ABSG31_09665 [Tepidisphaeraceae bacterium]|jgi:hypothetical protein
MYQQKDRKQYQQHVGGEQTTVVETRRCLAEPSKKPANYLRQTDYYRVRNSNDEYSRYFRGGKMVAAKKAENDDG